MLILRRILMPTAILAIVVFGFEEFMTGLGELGFFLLILVMMPTELICHLFGMRNPWQSMLFIHWPHLVLLANALLWAIPFAVIYWKILSDKSRRVKLN